MFKILGHDKAEYGPVSADVLRQWISQRRANAQTLVQEEGSPGFKPLSEFPEFRQALADAAAGAPPASTPGLGSGEPPAQGLAITSMVLGILSLLFFILTAIPAIITGHVALKRIRRDPARHAGKGFATAGLVLGYLNVALIPVIAVLAGLMLPALAKAKSKAQRITCVNQMKQIGLAARMYSNDNKEVFPPNFVSMSNELSTPKILVCPGDANHTRALDWSNFSESANVTYEYLLPGAKEEDVPQKVVFRCPIHNNVGLGDGSVQQVAGERWK